MTAPAQPTSDPIWATTTEAALVVADFTFVAEADDDTLTAIDHGLLTGDGPVRVSNSGGALPTGLAAATDYWVIWTGDNTFKLATSLFNAIAGTAINLTTDGTGTQTLSDTASTVRLVADIVAPSVAKQGQGWIDGERPPAEYFNYWQNLVYQWIAYLERGQHIRQLNALTGYELSGPWDTTTSVGEIRSAAGTDKWVVPLSFDVGIRVARLDYMVYGNGVNAINVNPLQNTDAGADESIGVQTSSTPAAAYTAAAVRFDDKVSGSISIAVDASDKTYTRPSGSFTTDGFRTGMRVTMAGFTNGGNNGEKVIDTVSALVITVTSDTGLVDEASAAGRSVSSSGAMIRDARTYYAQISALAAGLRFRNMHVTWDRPEPVS